MGAHFFVLTIAVLMRARKGRISPATHRRLIELIEWRSLVFNPRLSQWLLAGEVVGKRQTKNSICNTRWSCAPINNTRQTDPDQPYANSYGGSSMDSELIPLESGETCQRTAN